MVIRLVLEKVYSLVLERSETLRISTRFYKVLNATLQFFETLANVIIFEVIRRFGNDYYPNIS